ncbi:hypothetical protein K490DRAFT_62638 [Saccharata proteae CBS 121410]|uniref:RING-type domain-containing protein n=1 Tax=Saccharata proteae CBS 121410 TaxID=1314787 RepID=A0A9P4LZP3_9PEZI|nr:hypothetical protein K490DRAFT_62638 [Saccharata proteae CBS 121410]
MVFDTSKGTSGSAVAIVLPTVFAVILLMLIGVSVLLIPKLTKAASSAQDSTAKKRMLNLEKACRTQQFDDWCEKHVTEHPEYKTEHPVCTICLETIEDSANIRGLGCLHVFHQQCLDDWFSRWNEFCPLCHRPILPVVSKEVLKGKAKRTSTDTTDYSVASSV